MGSAAASEGQRVIGYARVSTNEQASSGLGMAVQRAAIEADCVRRGWALVDVVVDEATTGKTLDRPGLHEALRRIADGEAEALVVAKLDRVSRSVQDFAALLDWFERADATFIALDLAVDTSTPAGRLVANVLASVAEWEGSVISARTRDGLAAKRARGEIISRPAVSDRPDLVTRIQNLRVEGLSLQAIADDLNQAGVQTLRGGTCWRPSSVRSVLGYQRPRRPSTKSHLPNPRQRHKAGR